MHGIIIIILYQACDLSGIFLISLDFLQISLFLKIFLKEEK